MHQEIDTWLRYRRTCPILVDAQNLGRDTVPPQILELWPDVERLDWPRPGDESRLYRRIDHGILLSAIGVDQQDLGRIRRRNKYLTAAAFGLFVLLLAAVIFAGLAVRARNDAIAQTNTANSRRLAAQSELERPKRLDLSLLLAVEALRASEVAGRLVTREQEGTAEARTALFRALNASPGISSFLHLDKGDVSCVAFSPDGTTVAAGFRHGGDFGGVVLWDVCTHKSSTPISAKA